MLTTDQKEAILRKAGVAVPACPASRPCDQAHQTAAAQWARTIDTLFVEYSAARAARSLRDAEEVRLLGALRHASDGSTA